MKGKFTENENAKKVSKNHRAKNKGICGGEPLPKV